MVAFDRQPGAQQHWIRRSTDLTRVVERVLGPSSPYSNPDTFRRHMGSAWDRIVRHFESTPGPAPGTEEELLESVLELHGLLLGPTTSEDGASTAGLPYSFFLLSHAPEALFDRPRAMAGLLNIKRAFPNANAISKALTRTDLLMRAADMTRAEIWEEWDLPSPALAEGSRARLWARAAYEVGATPSDGPRSLEEHGQVPWDMVAAGWERRGLSDPTQVLAEVRALQGSWFCPFWQALLVAYCFPEQVLPSFGGPQPAWLQERAAAVRRFMPQVRRFARALPPVPDGLPTCQQSILCSGSCS